MGDSQGLPDYVLDANAVLNDKEAGWRHGGPPNYSKTREFYEQSRPYPHPKVSRKNTKTHSSLP